MRTASQPGDPPPTPPVFIQKLRRGKPRRGAGIFYPIPSLGGVAKPGWVARCVRASCEPLKTALLLPSLVLAHAACPSIAAEPAAVLDAPLYETRAEHNPDGIGKFYMGREIARVMGHEGAAWLERPGRAEEEHSEAMLAALELKTGESVADIGAGTGYYTRRLAAAVGPGGCVYAVDIQREMLDLLTNKLAAVGITNVVPVLGAVDDPKLPDACADLILMVDVYHEFDHPHEMVTAMCRALKPGGRMVFVEYRLEDPAVPIKPIHKMTEAQLRKEMSIQPLHWDHTVATLPRQHLIIFRKLQSGTAN